jgi:hypothetical protein
MRGVTRFSIAAAAFLFAGNLFESEVRAADACVDAGDKGYAQINSTYDPKINLFLGISGALRDKGVDPKKYPVVTVKDGHPSVDVIDLTDLVTKLALQKASAYHQVRNAVNDCNKGFAVPQKIMDTAVLFGTGGLSAVLPPQMTHVDISEFLNGKWFGGDGALIPHMREQALSAAGISGDVACIIRDPKKIFGGC